MRRMKFFAGTIATTLLLIPALASATSIDEAQTQLRYMLARMAALSADKAVSCTLLASKSRVHVGEQFTFLWFSTGKNSQTAHDGHQWDPFGVFTMALDKPGTWTHTLKFYNAAGAEVPCSTSIVVSP